MSVLDSAKAKLGDLWERIRGWAHSVPPDVWIGLAIAAATLIVVWLAYRKSGASGSSSSDTGTINPADFGGSSGGSSGDVSGSSSGTSSGPSSIINSIPGLSALPSLPAINWPNLGISGSGTKSVSPGAGAIIPTPSLQSIYNTIEANGQDATIASQQAAAAAQTTYMKTLNTNEANGQAATIAAVQKQQAATAAYLQAASPIDESSIAANVNPSVNPILSPAVVTSATTRDESSIVTAIKNTFTAPKPAPAPVRVNPFVVTAVPTGRGTNIAF